MPHLKNGILFHKSFASLFFEKKAQGRKPKPPDPRLLIAKCLPSAETSGLTLIHLRSKAIACPIIYI